MCPKFRNAPEEHIAPKVAVVTTSTFSAISFGESVFASSDTSSAVNTTAVPFLILSFISAYVLAMILYNFLMDKLFVGDFLYNNCLAISRLLKMIGNSMGILIHTVYC